MTHPLGRWAALDLETTGLDASYDVVIDVGYLLFDGLKLVKRYSSLVHPGKMEVSNFIQKLTGIKPRDLKKAPSWEEVSAELAEDLKDATIVAYNAGFEASFLSEILTSSSSPSSSSPSSSSPSSSSASSSPSPIFADGLNLLPLLFPQAPNFKLETFLAKWKLKPQEEHRGLADAEDMLKVLLTAVKNFREYYPEQDLFLGEAFAKYALAANWVGRFYQLTNEELEALAAAMDFTIPDLPTVGEDLAAAEAWVLPSAAEAAQAAQACQTLGPPAFSGEYLDKVFQQKDLMQACYPHHQYRPGQVQMAKRVGQALKNDVHAMIQAPTGTGKTLAYLLPAMLSAAPDDKILIATGTKTLQRQILAQEIPRVRCLLGLSEEDCPVAFMIGSPNHLCAAAFAQQKLGRLWEQIAEDERWPFLYLEIFFFYNEVLLRRGDPAFQCRLLTVANLPPSWKQKFKALAKLEKEITVDFRRCSGRHCPQAAACAYWGGLKLARQASLIIGNHALLLTWPSAVERPTRMIIDEAQGMEREATEAFHWELGEEELKNLAANLQAGNALGALYYLIAQSNLYPPAQATEEIQKLSSPLQEMGDLLAQTVDSLATQVAQVAQQLPRYTEWFYNEIPFTPNAASQAMAEIGERSKTVHAVYERLAKLLTPWQTLLDPSKVPQVANRPVYLENWQNFAGMLERIQEHTQHLAWALAGQEAWTWALRYKVSEGFAYYGALIDVGQIMYEQVLEPSRSVVFTSATLGPMNMQKVATGVEWPLGYAYLPPAKRFATALNLPPVYDYQNKSRILLADDVPSMYDEFFVPQILEKLIPLLERNRGRALLLFSARQRFETAREILLRDLKLPLFVQGMGLRPIDEFKAAGQGVLLGMEALGEGIDIPGDTLSLVFIDKIPDLRQDLIIKDRRAFFERKFGHEFESYFLAHRAQALAQKLGRLLRTEKDMGVGLVVDARLTSWKPHTWQRFAEMMAPYQLERCSFAQALQAAQEFLAANVSK